jgi:hypothetical protein
MRPIVITATINGKMDTITDEQYNGQCGGDHEQEDPSDSGMHICLTG